MRGPATDSRIRDIPGHEPGRRQISTHVLLHGCDRIRFTMHQERLTRNRGKTAKPAEDFFVVAVCRKAADGVNRRPDGIVDTENPDLPRSFRQSTPARTGGLKSDEDDGVPIVRYTIDQMMQIRPPVAIPFADRMIDGKRCPVIRLESSTVRMNSVLLVCRGLTPENAIFFMSESCSSLCFE